MVKVKRAFNILLTFILLLVTSNNINAQNWDIDLLRKINVNRNTNLDPTFKFLTKTATPVSIMVPITYLGYGLIDGDKAKLKLSLNTGITIAAAMTLSTVLKYSIGRTRPYKKYSDIQNLSSDFTPSFPSGHTTSVFCTATTLSLMYPKWYVIVPSFTWAAAVAYSRLHMGMHYPFDVLGGIILGMGTSYLSYRLQNRFK
jgi:membrane-associated phospholipid phosphatase